MVAATKYDLHWSGAGEEGMFGLWVANDGPVTQAQMETAVGFIVDEFTTAGGWGEALRTTLAGDQAYDHVTGYWHSDASQAADVSAVGNIGNAQGVGTGASHQALQQSMVVTLNTGHAGASYRGRNYVPLTGTALDATHQIDQTTMDTIGRAFAGTADGSDSWIRACGLALADGSTDAAVYSRKLNLLTPITSVRIDSRADVQRRRANSQVAVRNVTYPLRNV